jgi:hypothetical protein
LAGGNGLPGADIMALEGIAPVGDGGWRMGGAGEKIRVMAP